MTAYVPPRRVTSTATTITVNAAATTALAAAAQGVASNAFVTFAGTGLNTTTANSYTGLNQDVTCDGAQNYYTFTDWGGKGCYDPTPGKRRAMWMGKGIGNAATGWRFNSLAMYDEAADLWSATRAFRLPESSANANAFGIGHTYDNNCINVAGRRLYKKQFTSDSGFGSAPFHVYDLDNNVHTTSIAAPTGDDSGFGIGPADFIPTRGATGAIWYANSGNSDARVRLVEYDLSAGAWSTIGAYGSFASLPQFLGNGGVMSYNPRAFSGAGGVLLAGGSATAYTVNASTLAIASVGAAPMTLGLPSNGHICRDPVGTGWLMFGSDGFVYRCDGTSWTQRSALPALLTGTNFIVIPIDDYGVVWIIRERPANIAQDRAWLYRP